MLKREITYKDFNDEEVTETFYFNLTKSELVELEVDYEDGLEETIKRIVKTEDKKALIAEFKRLILLAYGEKTPDGKRFVKSDELREAFSQTAAYDAMFMEFATDDGAAADFIKGILPKDFEKEIERLEKESKNAPEVPPPPAPPTTQLAPGVSVPKTPGQL